MAYPKTGSTLSGPSGENRTSTSLSTNIVISVGPNTIGAIQNLNINESRSVTQIDEVGTDGHIDSVPTKSSDVSGSCRRIRFDRMRITEAFSRGFIHLKSQRRPFDIVIIDTWYGDGDKQLITTIKNVWITSISTEIQAGDWILTDSMDWVAETIHTTLGSGANAAQGGTRGIPLSIDPYEQAADRGERRGAIDAPGLIDIIGNF